MATPDISLIIVSWNVRELLRCCLRSLYATADGLALQVIVVDNASADGTPAMVAAEFPQVQVIASPVNLGFPRANNLALPLTTGRTILFLNPDTEVTPGALAALLAVLDHRLEVGLVGPRLVLPDGRVQLDGGRRFPSLLNAALDIFWLSKLFPRHPFFGRWKMGDWDHLDARDVPCLAGACLVARRAALERAGPAMDERTPMYFEDLDLCYRVGQAGYAVHYLGTAVVYHHQGQSSRVSPQTELLDMLEIAAPYLFVRAYAGGPWAARAFRLLLLVGSTLRGAVYGGLRRRGGAGRSARQLQRDVVRAAAWRRFALSAYRLAEAGALNL